MKKTVNSIMAAGILLTLILPACKKADSVYKQFLVPNGLYYPGKALNAEAHSGKGRVELSWQNSNDPDVEKARIFWNNYTDSVEVTVTPGMKRISIILEPPIIVSPLKENTYSFFIHTYDAKGNVSVPVEVVGRVYGTAYEKSLSNRTFKSLLYDGTNLLVEWAGAAYGEIFTVLEYTDKSQTIRQLKVNPLDPETLLPNFFTDAPFYVSTAYLPEPAAIDTLYAAREEHTFTVEDINRTEKLKNPGPNFFYGTRHGDTRYTIVDWTVENCGSLTSHVNTNPSYLGIWVISWATEGWGESKVITNGKVYQPVELDPGTYRFDVYTFFEADHNPLFTGYIVAGAGSGLPNVADVETSSSTLKFAPVVYDGSDKISIVFTVTAKSTVSLGFVVNMAINPQYYGRFGFTKVELWQTF